MTVTGPWYITRRAVECLIRIRRYPDSDFDRAERELIELMPAATYRATDSQGRQLWRSGRPLQLRWVVSFAARPEGELPQVVWVGQGRPPDRYWTPQGKEE